MKVAELIERLRACDQEATVSLADWKLQYGRPSAEAAAWPLHVGTDGPRPFVVLGVDPNRGPLGIARREIAAL